MQTATDTQQDELTRLKEICQQRRTARKRARYTDEFRRRVVALKTAGLSASHLQQELGLSSSLVFKWTNKTTPQAGPKIVDIRPPSPTLASTTAEKNAHQPLQLQVAGYRVTIELPGSF